MLDDSDFQKNVVASATKAGNRAGQSMGAQIAAGISTNATAIGKSLATVGREFTKAGRGLTTNLTLPIVAAGAAVSHFALDFDTSMRRIVGLAKVPKAEIQGVRDSILKMAADVGRSPQALADAFYFVASAGFKAEEAMKVLEIAAKASAAGMGEVQDIAKVLGGVINAYGHENITAAHAGDVLTAAIQDGAAEAADFSTAIGQVVPTASAMGVSFDQVTAAMSAMTNVGIDADTAATNLSQIFSSLLKPTTEADKALQGVGLSAAGLRSELKEKGLLATLRTLQKAFEGNDTAFATVFGNIRALRGVNALLSLDEAQLNAVFNDTAKALGTLGQAYDDTDGPQRRLDKAMASLQGTAIQLGADVLPMVVDVLTQIAGAAKELGKWWGGLDADTKKQIVQWVAWVAIAGPVLLLVGKLATGFGAVFRLVGFLAGAKGIPLLITWLGRLKLAALGALGPLGIILGLSGLQQDAAAKAKDQGRMPVGPWDWLLGDVLNPSGATASDVSDAMAKSLFTGWGPRGPIAKAADEVPKTIGAALKDGAFVVTEAATTGVVDPIQEALDKAITNAAKAANDLIHTLATTLASNPKELEDAAKAMWDDIMHPFPDIKQRLQIEGILANKTLIKGLTSTDSGDRARTAEYIKGLLANYELLAPGALAAGKELNPALQKGIDSTLAALKTYLTKTTGDITDQFALANELEQEGYASLAGYVRGLERARLGLMTTELTTAQRAVHEKLDINLETSGAATAATYISGFMKNFKLPHGFIESALSYDRAPGSDTPPYQPGPAAPVTKPPPKVGGFLPSFATGTPFVPRTGLALLHRGERVVPAAQNSAGGFSIGRVSIAVSGVGSDVSAGAASRFGQQVMDEFAARLRDQAGQVARARPVVP